MGSREGREGIFVILRQVSFVCIRLILLKLQTLAIVGEYEPMELQESFKNMLSAHIQVIGIAYSHMQKRAWRNNTKLIL